MTGFPKTLPAVARFIRRSGRLRPAAFLSSVSIAAILGTGCAGSQSALDPRGPVAEVIARTWWVMFVGGSAVLVVVMLLVGYAMFRNPERRPRVAAPLFLIGGGLLLPTVTLTALLVYGVDVGRRIIGIPDTGLVVEVTGHQWWWEVRYPATDDSPEVITANELYLPVGVPVVVQVGSADVVHSFWVPGLAGKIDAIPGRTNTLRFIASVPGRIRGQCSEFCGAQHARMGLLVEMIDEEAFGEWRLRRSVTPGPAEGFGGFEAAGCAGCHRIAGTSAAGTTGPDLTHVGARTWLGGGALVNDGDGLRRWLIRHGHDVKPGNLGPAEPELEPPLRDSLAAYLGGLR